MVSVSKALEVARFLWPEFVVREGAVLIEHCGGSEVGGSSSLTEAEILINHCHVLDYFEHKAGLRRAPFWNAAHPDFHAACELGKLAAAAWAAKLAREFPGRKFRVYFTRDDNPIVRFHQVRSGEPYFLDEDDWPDGSVVVHEVG
ncbi:MAG: hypothetical protein ABL997_11230 [Planctomycetota bacterium]